MAKPITTDVIHGVYARGDARLVITRNRATDTVTITLDRPCITLDAAGHHALLQVLAFPPAEPMEMHPVHGPRPAFSIKPPIGIGGPR